MIPAKYTRTRARKLPPATKLVATEERLKLDDMPLVSLLEISRSRVYFARSTMALSPSPKLENTPVYQPCGYQLLPLCTFCLNFNYTSTSDNLSSKRLNMTSQILTNGLERILERIFHGRCFQFIHEFDPRHR